MKLYREAPQASIKMSDDPDLVAAIEAAIKTYAVRVAIETGTFDGTGSTRTIAERLQRVGQPITFVTLEVSFTNWCKACKNLCPFPFVDCRWGCSVDRRGAVRFIHEDDAINDHHKFPEIFIDDVEHPLEFYLSEINGMLDKAWCANPVIKVSLLRRAKKMLKTLVAGDVSQLAQMLGNLDLTTQLWSGDGLLPKLLRVHRDNCPFVILDSAGGCGLYEFRSMMDIMGDTSFLLLLDDTHHLKHFRSLQQIKTDSRFTILSTNDYHGWALAWHR